MFPRFTFLREEFFRFDGVVDDGTHFLQGRYHTHCQGLDHDITDSRSFVSYPRHEYFRRTLCNLVGTDVENGEIPYSEIERVNQMIEDICYNNAKSFFQF